MSPTDDSHFVRHQNRIKQLLSGLDRRPLRYKEIMGIWLPSGASLNQLSDTMKWLTAKGYVCKQEPQKRTSPYEITVQGKKYLEGLKA